VRPQDEKRGKGGRQGVLGCEHGVGLRGWANTVSQELGILWQGLCIDFGWEGPKVDVDVVGSKCGRGWEWKQVSFAPLLGGGVCHGVQ